MSDENQNSVTSGNLSVGVLLQQGRKDVDLSISDVASILHISEEYVEALESDQYELLPAPIYVKGYIRNYAKLVQIDSEKIVQIYNEINQSLPEKSEELVTLAPELPKKLDPQWLVLGIISLILFLVFLFFSTEPEESLIKPEDLNKTEALKKDLLNEDNAINKNGDASEPDQKNSGPLGKKESGETFSVSDTGGIASEPEDQVSSIESTSSSEAFSSEMEELDETPVEGKDTLFMFFNGECWVSVKDAYDLEIYAALKKPGDSLELTGVAPFRVLLGNASVVSLNFNEKEIDLKPYTRKDSGTAVVRLKP